MKLFLEDKPIAIQLVGLAACIVIILYALDDLAVINLPFWLIVVLATAVLFGLYGLPFLLPSKFRKKSPNGFLFCISCGYNLRGLRANNEDEISCPECGSKNQVFRMKS